MELKGKKLAFLGDSITEGVGVSSRDKCYWSLVGQRTGAQVYADGIGGTKIAPPHFPLEDPEQERINRQYFLTRVDRLIPDADVVVIFGGTNDFGWGDAPLGSLREGKNDTFYGAWHQLLRAVFTQCPDAQLVIMTPLHRITEDEAVVNELGIRAEGDLRTYVRAIREVAEYYGIPVVDLFATCSIQPKVEAQRLRYMPDGLHPNDAGHEKIAQRLLSVLRDL